MLYLVDDCPIYLADVVFSQADGPRKYTVFYYYIYRKSIILLATSLLQYQQSSLYGHCATLTLRYRVGRQAALLIANQ